MRIFSHFSLIPIFLLLSFSLTSYAGDIHAGSMWQEHIPYEPDWEKLHEDTATKFRVVDTPQSSQEGSQEVITLPRTTPKGINDKGSLTYWHLFEYPGLAFNVAGVHYWPKTYGASNIIATCAKGMFSDQDYQSAGHNIRSIYGCDLSPLWKYQGLKFPLALTRKAAFTTSPFAGQGSLGSLKSSSDKSPSPIIPKEESTPVSESVLRCQYSAVAQMCFAEVFFMPCLEQAAHHIHTLLGQVAYDVQTDLVEFVKEYCTAYTNDVLECPKRLKEVSTMSSVSWATDHCKRILRYVNTIEEDRKNTSTHNLVEEVEQLNTEAPLYVM